MFHDWNTETDKVSTIADVILIDYQKAFDCNVSWLEHRNR